MRSVVVGLAISGALFGAALAPAVAQQGVVIENNGVNSSDSARGADNVNISRASGASSSNDGAGVGNEAGYVAREKNRDRKDRGERNANRGGGDETPADTSGAAPADDYQAYTEEGEWVEPVAAPMEASAAQPALDPNLPVQLPNTGVGASLPLAPLAAAGIAALMGGASVRRRRAA